MEALDIYVVEIVLALGVQVLTFVFWLLGTRRLSSRESCAVGVLALEGYEFDAPGVLV